MVAVKSGETQVGRFLRQFEIAGEPIEAIENIEIISVPQELLGKGENFCLRVKGESMVGDGIYDGDIVIINKRVTVNNNEMVAQRLPQNVPMTGVPE